MGLSSPAPESREKSESFYSYSKQEDDEERNSSPTKKKFPKRSSARGFVINSKLTYK